MHPTEVVREILSAFWKIHILHHAAEGPIAGHWMLKELREHGYDISPGTLYPLLKRMTARGWLERLPSEGGPKDPQLHRITDEGRGVLQFVRAQLAELTREIEAETRNSRDR
ncbi:MAG: PadR family transcriptional regulator [Opitutales bacterium]